MPVQTHLGIGEIVERSSVRGRSQVRVAGRGFSVWLDAKDVRTAAGTYENDLASETVNESNSTTLPYNPDPQVEGILDTQSTIVPGDYEVDADERLHPSNSLSFEDRSEPSGPQPNPDLFAKGGRVANERAEEYQRKHDRGGPDGLGEDDDPDWALNDGIPRGPQVHPRWTDELQVQPHDRSLQDHRRPRQATLGEEIDALSDEEQHRRGVPWWLQTNGVDPQTGESVPDVPVIDKNFRDESVRQFREEQKRMRHHKGQALSRYRQPSPDLFAKGSSRTARFHYAGPELVLPVADEALPEVLPPILGQGDEEEDPREDTSFGGNHSDLVQHGIDESPLGPIVEPLQKVLGSRGDLTEALGPKYATWMLEARVDHYNDPIQRFRDDPEGEIQRLGHIMSDTLDEDTKHYGMLIEADKEMREAAWTDVRAKASRLRQAGAVHVLDYSPGQIYASVDGDHGTYDVMVKRGNEYTGDTKVSDWNCFCKWGSWAFRRQYKHVGRLCSHALAALDEMQSRDHQGNPGKFQRLRLASKITDEFTTWAKNNDINIDIESVSDFLLENPDLTDAEIEDLYRYVSDNPTRREVRDYTDPVDWPETLTTQPKRLSPSLIFPAEDGEGDRHEMVDVQKDDRKTTGPGQIMTSSQRVADSDQPKDIADMMGVDPVSTPLTTNPFAGGGYDMGALPGVKGGPNTSPVTPDDPTGGILSGPYVGGGGTPTPPAPGNAGGDSSGSSWWDSSPGAASPASGGAAPSTPGTTGGGAAAGSNWTANDIAAGSIPTGQDYTIKPGDTLAEIAQGAGYGGNYQALADQNSIADPNKINAGDTLKIPGLDVPAAGAGDANAASGDVGVAAGGAAVGDSEAGTPHGLSGGAAPGPADTTTPGSTPSVTPDVGTPPVVAPPLEGADLTNPGLTPPATPEKVSRYLYAEDFEIDPLEELRDISGERGLGSAREHNDHVRKLVDALHDDYRMDASQMVAALEVEGDPHQGFTGSGSNPKYVWGTSEEYVNKNEKPHQVDVTDLDEMIRYTEKEAASDVVRRFQADLQREGSAIDGPSSGGQYSDDAIAARADAMIRTAGRKFSPQEQRELEDESHPLGARNMPTEADLQGTHYVD